MSEIVFEKCEENIKIIISSLDNDYKTSRKCKLSEKIDKNALSVEYFIENDLLQKSINRVYSENNCLHNKCLEISSKKCLKHTNPHKKPNAIRILNIEDELAKINHLNEKCRKNSSCCLLF